MATMKPVVLHIREQEDGKSRCLGRIAYDGVAHLGAFRGYLERVKENPIVPWPFDFWDSELSLRIATEVEQENTLELHGHVVTVIRTYTVPSMAEEPMTEEEPMAFTEPTTSSQDSSVQEDTSCWKLEPKHKIFLSHSGAQKPFVEQLCKDLEACNHFAFFDQRSTSLPKGEKFAALIIDAAQRCQVAVVVLSEMYLSSKWPMLELVEFVRAMKSGNGSLKLLPLFYKASVVDLSDEAVEKKWRPRWMKLAVADPRLDLEEWAAAVRELRGVNGLPLDMFGNSEVSYRKAIVNEIFMLSPPAFLYDTSEIFGCDRITQTLAAKFRPGFSICAQVLGLYGMGGLGKTTMSKSLCNYFNKEFLGRVCYVEIKEKENSALDRQRMVMRKLLRLDESMLQRVSDVSEGWELLQSRMEENPVFLVIDNVQFDGLSDQEARKYLNMKYNRSSKIMIISRSLDVVEGLLGKSGYCSQIPCLTRQEAAGVFLREAAPRLDYSSLSRNERTAVEACLREAWFSHDVEPFRQNGGGHFHPLVLKALGVYLYERSQPSDVLSWNTDLHEYGKVKGTRESYKRMLKILGLQFNKLDRNTQLMFVDISLYASEALKAPMLSNSPLDELIAWLANVHRESAEVVRDKIFDFKRYAMITIEGMRVIVHDLYKDVAIGFLGQLDNEEVTAVWCVGSHKDDDDFLPPELQQSPQSCWLHLKRIRLEGISFKGFLMGIKVQEWRNIVVLQIVRCHKLVTIHLQGLTCLRHLELKDLFGLQTLTIPGYGNSSTNSNTQWRDTEAHQYYLPPLQFVTIVGLSSLECLPSFSPFTSLKFLMVGGCESLKQPPSVQHCSGLQRMVLLWHPNQKTLPSLDGLTSLRDLTIRMSPSESYKGRALELHGLSSLVSLGALELCCIAVRDLLGLQNLTRLEYICLKGMQYLTCLPPLDNLARSSLHRLEVTFHSSNDRLEGLDEPESLVKVKPDGLAARRKLVVHTPSKIRDAWPRMSGGMDDYDVFLNHRGPDVKATFVAHLHDALLVAGLNPFLDIRSLMKGSNGFEVIDDALAVAKVHVAVVSRGYAESTYCLSELVAMLRSGKPVIPVFYDVERAHLRSVENGPFAAAFEKHRSRQPVDRVEEWADALRKLAGITGFVLSECQGDEAELKQKVVNATQSLLRSHDALQVESILDGPLTTYLEYLELWGCEKVRELPNSIGALTSLKELLIVKCTSMTELPTSIGHLSSLRVLRIEDCGELQSLPNSVRQLNALQMLQILDCGSLEGLDVLRVLEGLRIWGCTSITELPGSSLVVVDSDFWSPAWIWDREGSIWVRRYLMELRKVETNDCGFLRHVQDTGSERLILQRVHNLPCYKTFASVYKETSSCRSSFLR